MLRSRSATTRSGRGSKEAHRSTSAPFLGSLEAVEQNEAAASLFPVTAYQQNNKPRAFNNYRQKSHGHISVTTKDSTVSYQS
jgi:hypothetical protein